MRDKRSSCLMLFLLGLFSETQIRIVGSIGISEVFIYAVAPIMLVLDYRDLKRNGFVPVIVLAIMSCVGCIIACVYNGTDSRFFYRGFATAYSLFAIPIVLHHYLWRNLNGFKWMIIGVTLSSILTLFVFTSAAEMAIADNSVGNLSSGQLYYLAHFGPLSALSLNCFYMNIPTWGSLLLYSIPTIYTVFTTATGRSAILGMTVTIIMVFLVGRSVRKMRLLKRHILSFFIVSIGLAFSVSTAYRYLAMHDYLTVEAKDKYIGQTRKGEGMFSLLMSGRSEFFIGLIAAFDEPIYGHGPWPIDKKGYSDEYVREYGVDEDYRKRIEWDRHLVRTYGRRIQRTIPCHSMIVGNWLFFGILGLPYWFYILFKMLELLRRHIDAVPQLFGYFAIMLPSMFWGIFFSGYGSRFSTCSFTTLMLLAIATGKGIIRLPENMLFEISRNSER